jgi:hypothetical protein
MRRIDVCLSVGRHWIIQYTQPCPEILPLNPDVPRPGQIPAERTKTFDMTRFWPILIFFWLFIFFRLRAAKEADDLEPEEPQ